MPVSVIKSEGRLAMKLWTLELWFLGRVGDLQLNNTYVTLM